MTDAEIERRRVLAMTEAAPDWEQRAGRSDGVGVRIVDEDGQGNLLIIASVVKDERARFLAAFGRHFPGVPVKFSDR